MGFTLEQDLESTLIRLDGTVEVASAAEFKQILMDALHRARPVRVALEAVTGIDVTGVQLLWAAQREANSCGVPFTAASALPDAVAAHLRGLGFDGFPVSADEMGWTAR